MSKEYSVVPILLVGWLGIPCIAWGLMFALDVQINWDTLALVFLGPFGIFLGSFSVFARLIAALCWLFIPVLLLKKPWYYMYYVGWIAAGVVVTKALSYMVQ